jgi:hypothetical protein
MGAFMVKYLLATEFISSQSNTAEVLLHRRGKLLGDADKTDTKSDPETAAGDAQSGDPSLMQRR